MTNQPLLVSAFASPEGVADSDQPLKLGLWATGNMRVTRWLLAPGQRIVVHAHPAADDVVVVIAGEGHYLAYKEREPPQLEQYVPQPCEVVVPPAVPPSDEGSDPIPISEGHVVIAHQNAFHGVVNTGTRQMIVIVATGPDIRGTRYVTR